MPAPIIDTQDRIVQAQWTFNVLPKNIGDTLKAGDTTPDVSNRRFLYSPSSATTVTQFDNGADFQELVILGNGNLTVSNNANIVTNTGANKVLATGKVYRFTKFGTKWYEDA